MNKMPIVCGEIPTIVITMSPIADKYTLDNIDWSVEFFATRGRVTINKRSAERIDENSYAVRVDTQKTGVGKLLGILYPQVPDSSVDGGIYAPPVPFDPEEVVVSPYYMRDGLPNS